MGLPFNTEIVRGVGKDGFFTIKNGFTNVHPISVRRNALEIAAVHTAQRPDLTLRAWISQQPRGMGLRQLLETERFVNIPRRVYVWTLYPNNKQKPQNPSVQYIPLEPGDYFFNIENEENAENGYRIFFRDFKIGINDNVQDVQC